MADQLSPPARHVTATAAQKDIDDEADSRSRSPPLTSIWVNHEVIPAHFAPTAAKLVLTGAALGALIGTSASLVASAALSPRTPDIHSPPSSPSSWRSTLTAPQLHLYLFSWAMFHLLEFLVTARWNPTRLMKDSFLLQNGWNYHAAHFLGVTEFILESRLLAERHSTAPAAHGATVTPSTAATVPAALTACGGLGLVALGQYLRSTAMIHASSNFSHQVAHTKRHDHVLVTTGVYAWCRHPSYAGFLLWAMGTQVLLANPISAVVFAAVLWSFFSKRIRAEERFLVDFFGDDYRGYRSRVWSGVPLVP